MYSELLLKSSEENDYLLQWYVVGLFQGSREAVYFLQVFFLSFLLVVLKLASLFFRLDTFCSQLGKLSLFVLFFLSGLSTLTWSIL